MQGHAFALQFEWFLVPPPNEADSLSRCRVSAHSTTVDSFEQRCHANKGRLKSSPSAAGRAETSGQHGRYATGHAVDFYSFGRYGPVHLSRRPWPYIPGQIQGSIAKQPVLTITPFDILEWSCFKCPQVKSELFSLLHPYRLLGAAATDKVKGNLLTLRPLDGLKVIPYVLGTQQLTFCTPSVLHRLLSFLGYTQ